MCKIRGTAIVLGSGATHGVAENYRRWLMKRVVALMAMVALTAVMMATSVAPAFALALSPCPGQSILSPVASTGEIQFDRNGDGLICEQLGHKPRDNKY
jgi:hypothetical protein